MRHAGLMELHWCYSDLILLFKRTFTDIWEVWSQLNTAIDPGVSLLCFTGAVFLLAFAKLSAQPDPSAFSNVMEAFALIVKDMDTAKLAKLARWIYIAMKDDEEFLSQTRDALAFDPGGPEDVYEFFSVAEA
jgi:hypothetical protein